TGRKERSRGHRSGVLGIGWAGYSASLLTLSRASPGVCDRSDQSMERTPITFLLSRNGNTSRDFVRGRILMKWSCSLSTEVKLYVLLRLESGVLIMNGYQSHRNPP